MDKPLLFFIIFSILIIGGLTLVKFADAERFIPPTPAFSMINGSQGNITATKYNNNLELINGSGISFLFNNAKRELTITGTSAITAPIELYCTLGDFLNSFNATTGVFTCGTPVSGGGQNNTMSSPTHANSLVLPKVGADLPIKGIACGGSIICSSNNTDVTVTYTATGGGNARESSVAVWNIDKTWANIGTPFVNVYTTGIGDPIRIDTNGKTTATLIIDWTKVGVGTQKCTIISTTIPSIELITFDNLVSGLNTNATFDIPTNAENRIDTFVPMCKSTTATDDPVWLTGQVLLR